jgi:hypothetical protein
MTSRRPPEFAAVLVIATEAFLLDKRVWKHIDSRRHLVHFDEMLADPTFSTQERLLLEIAASLWSSSDHPTILSVVAERLGEEWLAVLIRALAAARGARVTPRPRP